MYIGKVVSNKNFKTALIRLASTQGTSLLLQFTPQCKSREENIEGHGTSALGVERAIGSRRASVSLRNIGLHELTVRWYTFVGDVSSEVMK